MLGVARIVFDPATKRGEAAVPVGDPWQGKGIGTLLLERCLQIAKVQGVETVQGQVFWENRVMIALARKLGFGLSRIPETGMCELSIDLGSEMMTD